MASAKPAILAALARRGWVCHASARAEAVLDEIRVLGDLLGARAVGRAAWSRRLSNLTRAMR